MSGLRLSNLNKETTYLLTYLSELLCAGLCDTVFTVSSTLM